MAVSRASLTTLELTPSSDLIQAFGAQWLRLLGLTRNADVIESSWTAGMTPVLPEDTTERSIGMTSDPTSVAAFDARRLKVRASMIAAEQALILAVRAMRKAERELTEAVDVHNGSTVDDRKQSRTTA